MTYLAYGGFSGCDWRKVDGRWVQWSIDGGNEVDNSTFILPHAISPESKKTQEIIHRQRNERFSDSFEGGKQWQPMLRNVQGTGTLRRINSGLSDGLKMLDLDLYAFEQRGFLYCVEFYTCLLEKCISKISGTTQRHLFSMIERMVDRAISTELHIPVITKLLQTAAALTVTQHSNQLSVIGSRSLWKKNRDIVNNCLIRVQNFQYTQRADDGKPCLLDLPKETLVHIMHKLSEPLDIFNLGATCWYLHDVSQDPQLWRQMAFFHFTEKQLFPFISEGEFLCLEWQIIFMDCLRKHKKLKHVYGDEVALCESCRCLHWRIAGHQCVNVDQLPPYSTPVSPLQLMELFHL